MYSSILQQVPIDSRTYELCLYAVQQNGMEIQFVPQEHRTNELCSVAVSGDGMTIEYVPPYLKQDFCSLAVKQNGMALARVPTLLKTKEVCSQAVKQNIQALLFVNDEAKIKIASEFLGFRYRVEPIVACILEYLALSGESSE